MRYELAICGNCTIVAANDDWSGVGAQDPRPLGLLPDTAQVIAASVLTHRDDCTGDECSCWEYGFTNWRWGSPPTLSERAQRRRRAQPRQRGEDSERAQRRRQRRQRRDEHSEHSEHSDDDDDSDDSDRTTTSTTDQANR